MPKHTVENTARMYVSELAQRSFLQVVPTSIIHECAEEIRIHDIIRDWCIEEAAQDGFLDVIHETTAGELSFPLLFICIQFLKYINYSCNVVCGFYFAAKVILLPRPAHRSIVMDDEVSNGPLEVIFVL